MKQIFAEKFTPYERDFLEHMVRPTVESGKNFTNDRVVYLQAQKPLS